MRICSDRAAIISPWELRTTTPIPAEFKSSKTASSKLVFSSLGSSDFHGGRTGWTDFGWAGWAFWNSCSSWTTWSNSLSIARTTSFILTFFRRFHRDQQVMANRHGFLFFERTNSTSSINVFMVYGISDKNNWCIIPSKMIRSLFAAATFHDQTVNILASHSMDLEKTQRAGGERERGQWTWVGPNSSHCHWVSLKVRLAH